MTYAKTSPSLKKTPKDGGWYMLPNKSLVRWEDNGWSSILIDETHMIPISGDRLDADGNLIESIYPKPDVMAAH